MTTTTAPTAPAVPTQAAKVRTIRDYLLAQQKQIELALPRHLNADRFLRTAFTAFNQTPALYNCSTRSLLGALIQSAQLGLEPGVLGHLYLVPFANRRRGTTEVTVIPGYKGLLELARRSGQISTIQAHVVRQGDRFAYQRGLTPKLEHVQLDEPWEEVRNGAVTILRPVTHVYAVARLKDGGAQFEVMTAWEINRHKDRFSRAAGDGPWVTNWDEMAMKTVLRRLSKLLPASIDLQKAVALDERAEGGIPQELGDLVMGAGLDEEPAPTANGSSEPSAGGPSALDQLAGQLKGDGTQDGSASA